MSNEVLLDAFRHNSWATKHLLKRCRELSADQLATTGRIWKRAHAGS